MIRSATYNDLTQVWQLRLETAQLLKDRKIDQWQYENPSYETIKKDIENNEFFVYEEQGVILGMISIKSGIERTYNVIYDGKWGYDLPYLTIHRLAVKRSLLGQTVAKELMQFAEELGKSKGIYYIRIDTHEKNRYAIRLFESFEYIKRGWIMLDDKEGDLKRLAYDKKLKEDMHEDLDRYDNA
ncbi:GNAT family N-acetyltransferase [Peloplasma aerotolerans]|uniref:GNAT family N-acetyltransferase n=1 Tax=Peloplasma aerotolerans TaxID=3044389 RepID=A0AAW6U898_9MOLU|nr:GNAT family N-acetyltransferase [Mariniplasma sp. M4Ah]MDI6452990.1 GNAT family N-acetyltransferase [Mariniplasma sp. M4Ah]